MTRTETIAAIKALPGMTCSYVKDTGEYRVSMSIYAICELYGIKSPDACERKNEKLAYYSEDAEDALGTARAMVTQAAIYAHRNGIFDARALMDVGPLHAKRAAAIEQIKAHYSVSAK